MGPLSLGTQPYLTQLATVFRYHEGGPPTPMEEPLSLEMRKALGRGHGAAQIGCMLDAMPDADADGARAMCVSPATASAAAERASSDCVYYKMPMSPAAASGMLSPQELLSPSAGPRLTPHCT